MIEETYYSQHVCIHLLHLEATPPCLMLQDASVTVERPCSKDALIQPSEGVGVSGAHRMQGGHFSAGTC